jgi:RNA 2',3'-cyclic 3'-phosphodiesterase
VSEDERLRLFVAVDLPPQHLARVESITRELGGKLAEARWIAPENQHITLKFLGATGSDRLAAVTDACASVAFAHRAFDVSFSGLGAFPSARRMRVLWLGIDDPARGLEHLALDLDRLLVPLGFPAEERAFTPHLTMARFKVPARLDGPLAAPAGDLSPMSVDHLALYRSRLSPKGASYERLEAFALA